MSATDPATDVTANRRRLANQVRDNIEADFGKMPLLRMFSDVTARAIIDGYVLRLLASRDESTEITLDRIETLRLDASSVILFQL